MIYTNLRYLVKIPALAMIMAAEIISLRSPNPPPENTDRKLESKFSTAVRHWYPPMDAAVNLCAHLCELVAILAREFSLPFSNPLLSVLFKHTHNVDNIAITPTFVIGFLLVIIGAAWRKKCYDTLGRFFTFDLALLKEHKLVTTGSYAIVRHPSYTAFVMMDIGCFMTIMLPGSYTYECGILETRWCVMLAALWGIVHVAPVVAAVRRGQVEDSFLREEFGSQWDAWAGKTPYALIPYVY